MTKKLEFVTIRTQVSGLWSQGKEVQCGAVVNETRVGKTHTHTHIPNSIVLHMQVNIDSSFTRLCFVLHLVRCSSSSKSAPRCGNLTHQVRMCTNMEMVDNLLCTLIRVHGHRSFATLATVLIVCKIYFDVLHFVLLPWLC